MRGSTTSPTDYFRSMPVPADLIERTSGRAGRPAGRPVTREDVERVVSENRFMIQQVHRGSEQLRSGMRAIGGRSGSSLQLLREEGLLKK